MEPSPLAAVLDAIDDAVIGFDSRGQVAFANARVCALFRTTRPALIGKGFAALGLRRAADNRRLRSFRGWTGLRLGREDPEGVFIPAVKDKDKVFAARIFAVAGAGDVRYAMTLRPSRHLGVMSAHNRAIVELAGDAIIVVDERQDIRYFNRAAEGIFGYSREEVVGKPLATLIPERFRWGHAGHIGGLDKDAGFTARYMADRRAICGLRKDGTEFPAEVSISRTEWVGRCFYTAILRDVTARRHLEEHLNFTSTLLRTQMESSPDGVLIVDANDRTIAFNSRFIEHWKLPHKLVEAGADRPVREAVAAQVADPERFLARVRYLYEHPDEIGHDEIVCKDGRVFDGYTAPLYDADRRYLGRAWFCRDMTRDRAREAEIERAGRLLRVAFDNMEEGIVVYGPGDILTAYNRRFLDMWQLSPNDVQTGLTHARVIEMAAAAGAYGKGVRSAARDRLRSFRENFARDRVTLANGKIISIRRRRLPDGGFVATYRDITELALSERREHEGQKKLGAIVENSGDAILTLDAAGGIESANSTSVTMFGLRVEELKGRPFRDLVPGFPLFWQTGKGDERPLALYRSELMAQRRDNTLFPVDLVASTVRVSQDTIYVVNIRDISERRRLQEELVQASKLSTLGEMAAGMAHEMNQPLSVMRMAADNALLRLERGKAEERYLAEAFELIANQAGKLGELILNLRIFARREQGAATHSFVPSEAAAAACHLMRGKVSLELIDLVEDYDPGCRPVVGGGGKFEQVIVNLIVNAYDAILENRGGRGGTRRDKIVVEVRDAGGDAPIRVCVSDTGGGIPAAIMDKIFNPFFTSKEVGKGTGLGLSISYGIVSEMGGTIKAENWTHGARITITLPPLAESVEWEMARAAASQIEPGVSGTEREAGRYKA